MEQKLLELIMDYADMCKGSAVTKNGEYFTMRSCAMYIDANKPVVTYLEAFGQLVKRGELEFREFAKTANGKVRLYYRKVN